MRPRRELTVVALALAAVGAAPARAESAHGGAAKGGDIFDAGQLGNKKEPITITSDSLEYDYKTNVVVYRGEVVAVQGDTKLRSDTLTVTFENPPRDPNAKAAPVPAAATTASPDDAQRKLHDIVAVGGVRIDNGTRWATGGRAVFDQGKRTVVLTEEPMLHDGQNEVAGDRVVVFLDENRSVVEGGRKRVKAVLYPGKNDGLSPGEAKPADAKDADAKRPPAPDTTAQAAP